MRMRPERHAVLLHVACFVPVQKTTFSFAFRTCYVAYFLEIRYEAFGILYSRLRKEPQDLHAYLVCSIARQVKDRRFRVFELDKFVGALLDNVGDYVPPRQFPCADESSRQEEYPLHPIPAEDRKCHGVVIQIPIVERNEHTRPRWGVTTHHGEHFL